MAATTVRGFIGVIQLQTGANKSNQMSLTH
jgi:hypothetical protein